MTESLNAPHPAPPQIALRRRLALGALMFLTTGAWGFIQPLVPLFLQSSGLGKGEIGFVTGVGTALVLLIQPLLGRWVDASQSVRAPIIVAAWVAALGFFLFPLAHHILTFTVLFALGVNGFLFLNVAGAVIAGHIAPGGQGAADYARYRVWGSIGYLIVALISGIALSGRQLDVASLSPIFRWGPLLYVAIALLVPFLPDIRGAHQHGASAVTPPRLRPFFVACFLFFFAFNGMLSLLSLYLQSLGATPLWVTATWAAGVGAEAWMMTRIGQWSDKHGRRAALLIAFAALPLRCLLLIFATTPLWVLGVQMSEAFCYGIIGIVSVAYLNDATTGATRGAAQAKMAGILGLCMCSGPLVAGVFADAFGIRALFALMACVATVGLWVFWRFVD